MCNNGYDDNPPTEEDESKHSLKTVLEVVGVPNTSPMGVKHSMNLVDEVSGVD